MTTQIPAQPKTAVISAIHANTDLTLIQITEDKLRLALYNHLEKCENRNRWQVPMGVLLALIPVLLTSDFKDAATFTKEEWKAFFMFCTAGSFIWLLFTIKQAFTTVTVDQLIDVMKNSKSTP